MRTLLIRYWFEFEQSDINELHPELITGCGITAFDYSDALSILKQIVFNGQPIPQFMDKKENVDIRTLEQRHVVVNMKDPTLRGVWYPGGFTNL
jgi:hypothetical protein